MEKTKIYKNALFDPEVVKAAYEKFVSSREVRRNSFKVSRGVEEWEFDDQNEFYSDYRKPHESSTLSTILSDENTLRIYFFNLRGTTVTVSDKTRGAIENIFEVFEREYEKSLIPIVIESKPEVKPSIFIGHGRSNQWRDLKDHLSDKHDYSIVTYETGARTGHTIRDILDEMITKSSFAILVMTGEDESIDGKLNARPNVIHEAGLFQGRLGFSRAIVLLEEGTEIFSNLDGIQQIRYSKDNIKETFGEVLATLKREFEKPKIK